MQEFWFTKNNQPTPIRLPPPEDEVLPGVPWGRADALDTAAYWALRCKIEETPLHGFVCKGADLIEEIGFCLLGGFGVTAELNCAAFARLKSEGVFDLDQLFDLQAIQRLLSDPLIVHERARRYRFPNQRAKRIYDMRTCLLTRNWTELSLKELKSQLLEISGVGPKTAAWILRNHLGSEDVAILDIHVVRACQALKIFPENIRLPRDYDDLEGRFLRFAQAIGVSPAVLDAVIWTEMRSIHRWH